MQDLDCMASCICEVVGIILTFSYIIQISPSLRRSKHSTPESCLEDSSYQESRDQELELSGESTSMPSAMEVSFCFFLYMCSLYINNI